MCRMHRTLAAVKLTVDVPAGLLQILDGVALEIRAPDVLHRVAEVEAHVFGDLDALDPAGMIGVVGRVVHRVSHRWPFIASSSSDCTDALVCRRARTRVSTVPRATIRCTNTGLL